MSQPELSTPQLPPQTAGLPDFSDTEIAFAHLSDGELRRTGWLFRSMNKAWLVKLSNPIALWAVENRLPGADWAVKKTIFSQFCGGTTLLDIQPSILTELPDPPINLCLVLDRSTSMQGARLDQVKGAFTYYLKHHSDLPAPADIVNVIERGNKPAFQESVYVNVCKKEPGLRTAVERQYVREYEHYQTTGEFQVMPVSPAKANVSAES